MGSIFAKLMKQGVAADGQPTQYYDNPALAGKTLAAMSARTAQPGTSTVDGTIGAPTVTTTQPGAVPEGGIGPMQDSVVTATPTQDKTTVGFSSPPVAPQPGITHPTWRDAQMSNATGGPDLMTTKGKLLNLVLSAGVGAAAGDAAARTGDPRHGYPGLGASALAGLQVSQGQLDRLRAQHAQQAQMDMEQQRVDAEQQNAESRSSMADAASTRASRVQTRQGLAEQGPDGKWRIVPGTEPDTQTAGDKENALIQARIAQAKAGGLQGADYNSYVYNIHPGNETAYKDWRAANPNSDVLDYYTGRRAEGSGRATPTEFSRMNARKASAIALAERAYARVPEPATFDWKKADEPTRTKYLQQRAAKDAALQVLQNAKDQAESAYGNEIISGGGSVTPGPATPPPLKGAASSKQLTQGIVDEYMRQAGGDHAKAKALAAAAGYKWGQ